MPTFLNIEVEVGVSIGASWADIDLSSYLPSGAVAAIIRVVNTSGSSYGYGLRKKGSSDARTNNRYANSHTQFIIGVDTTRFCQGYKANSAIKFYIQGYLTSSEATFLTNGTSKSIASGGTLDLSSDVPEGTVFAIFESNNNAGTAIASLRKPVSGDDGTWIHSGHTTFLVPLDADRKAYCFYGSTQTIYLLGYITIGKSYFCESIDIANTSTGVYQTVDLTKFYPTSKYAVFSVEGTGTASFHLRKKGSSDEFYKGRWVNGGTWIIELDDNNQFEYKVSDLGTTLRLKGFLGEQDDSSIPPYFIQSTIIKVDTTYGAWQPVDLTEFLPSHATGVIIEHAGLSFNTGIRPSGCIDDTVTPNTNACVHFFVELTSNKTIEVYQSSSSSWRLRGYFGAEATWFPDAEKPLKQVAATDVWTDVNCVDILPITAKFAIVFVQASATTYGVNLRAKNATDDRYYATYSATHFGFIVPLNNGVFQVKTHSAALKMFIWGYITVGTPKLVSSTDCSIGTTGSYQDVDLSADSPDYDYAIIELFSGAQLNAEYWVRPDGATEDLYSPTSDVDAQNGTVVIKLTSDIFEGKISDSDIDFFCWGYFPLGMDLQDLVPTMEAPNVPYPVVISASYNTSLAYRIFDDNYNTWWDAIFPPAITYRDININFGSGQYRIVTNYTLRPRDSWEEHMPYSWELWASNDAFSTWVVLDTQTGITFSYRETKVFNVVNTTGYRYYRLHITAPNPAFQNIYIGEMQLIGTVYTIPPNDSTLNVNLPVPQENGSVSGMNDLTSSITPIFNSNGSGTNDCESPLPTWVCNAGGYWMDASHGDGWLPAWTIYAVHIQTSNDMAATFPLFTLTGQTEAIIGGNVTFPMLTIDAAALTGTISILQSDFPKWIIEAETEANITMIGDMILPMLLINTDFKTGTVSTTTSTLPMLVGDGLLILVSPTTSTAYLVLPALKIDAYSTIVSVERYRVYTVNLKNLGISEYDSYGFNSVCKFNGRYYGMNESGLYVLEGDSNDGNEIEAVVETGRDDFKMRNMKHIADAFITMRADGEYMFGLVDENGQVFEYPITKQMIEAGTAKIDAGKGRRSQYWGIRLRNIAGSKFDFEALELNIEGLRRRHR
jgi:hypothetical protein